MSINIPEVLNSAIMNIYKPSGMRLTGGPIREKESAGYGACRFSLNGLKIIFRVARTTPSKIGQFVTLWKRSSPESPIVPFHISDPLDFVIVSVSDGLNHGQFIFDREVLLKRNIMSQDQYDKGKRAIRLYPPWTTPKSMDALKTQIWQSQCFLSINQDGTADFERALRLFKC